MTEKYFTVSEITEYIARKFSSDSELKSVYIQGEISNFTNHRSSGHMYFTLKDDHAQIPAVMFSGYNRHLKFIPEAGMSVITQGEIGVYKPHGRYQLYVYNMQPAGIGALYLAFEQLKEKLSKEGLFDEIHKKPIPKYPINIGIITAEKGAALQDMLTTFENRYPIAKLTLFPSLVQGESAPDSIIYQIEKANTNRDKFDLLILARGGGSIEDLQAFNDERVARAIFNSDIPIVTGIGHETDITISDMVADLRAPTPTGAVVLSVPSVEEIEQQLNQYNQSLYNYMNFLLQQKFNRLKQIKESYAFRSPEQLVKQKQQQLKHQRDLLVNRINHLFHDQKGKVNHLSIRLTNQNPQQTVLDAVETLSSMKKKLIQNTDRLVQDHARNLSNLIDKLKLTSPLHTIQRGFALPYNEEGDIIKSHNQVEVNEDIIVEISDGYLDCKVKNVREKDDDKIKL